YVLKIVPLDNNTGIWVDNQFYPGVSINNTLVVDIGSEIGKVVHASKPFHCLQFMKGGSSNGYFSNGVGDPAILSIMSTKHLCSKDLNRTVRTSLLRTHFMNIVVPASATNNVK